MERLERGKESEELAVQWLLQRGFELVARNVRYKFGEIDIIAKEGQVLCFVEVRSRENAQYGAPQASVRFDKQAKLIKAAQMYLKRFYKKPPFCRFDVIAVTGFGIGAQVEHFKSAFEVPAEPRRYRGNPWRAY